MKNFKIKVSSKTGLVYVNTITAIMPGAALILFSEKNNLKTGDFSAIAITIEKD